MSNPYIQVTLTYFRHPFGVLQRYLLLTIILYIFAMLFLPSILLAEKHIFVSILLLLFMIQFAYWTIHVKEQFADPRASLTPGFRKVHGVVSTIVAFVSVIPLPALIASPIGWQALGFVSATTFLFGIILWAILRLGNNFIILMVSGWIFTLFAPTQNSIEKIVSESTFIFLGAGAVLSITGIIRLFLLDEEKPEYHLNLKNTIDGRTERSGSPWRKLETSNSLGLRRRFTNRTAARMIYYARNASDSYWSRMHRWNFSNRFVWSALFHATLINLFLMLIYSLANGTFLPEIRIHVATLMPIVIVNKQFIKKGRFMARDLMMPVKRDAYLKQVGISFAASLFVQWGVFLVVTVLLMFTSAEKPTPEFVIVSVFYSAMSQIWGCGLFIWLSSFSFAIMSIMNYLIIIKAIFLVMISFVSTGNPQEIISGWALIIGWCYLGLEALFVYLGVMLAAKGYDRWMVADFD